MASSLAHADESSALPKGTLKEVRAALDAFNKSRDPKGHKAFKKNMARTARGYIENAPLHVLARELHRRLMAEKEKLDACERKRIQRARAKMSA